MMMMMMIIIIMINKFKPKRLPWWSAIITDSTVYCMTCQIITISDVSE